MQETIKPKILCVDDEFINLELFKLAFENDYDVFVSENPIEGLDIIMKQDIKVILTDFKMPDMNGIEFIKAIKNKNPQCICILVTAFLESKSLLNNDPESLIFDYILKPWNYEEVKKTINKAFQIL